MNGTALKDLVESNGVKPVIYKLTKLLQEKKIKPEDFSLRELWEAFVGPCSQTLQYFGSRNQLGFVELTEAAVDSTAFPQITGQLIAAKVIEGYNAPGYIGESLVTNMPSKFKSEKMAGFSAVETLKEVAEGMPYEDSTLGEKYVTTETAKKGRILSLTEEAIFFDQTGQILVRAKRLGERAQLDKEKTILNGVLGLVQCYRPSGVATTLYTNTWELLATNVLTDWTDIDNAIVQRDKNAVDEEGETIVALPKILLCSGEKLNVAKRIINATEVKYVDNTVAAGHQIVFANPYGGTYVIASSPLVYNLQLAAAVAAADCTNNWWLGDFTEQFFWQEIWPIQTLMAKAGHEEEFEKDVTFRYKVRHYGGVFAVDNQHVIKNTD